MADRTLTHPKFTTVQLPTTIGLDLSDRVSHYHVMRGDGTSLATGKVATERRDLTKLFAGWKGCRLVIEAGGHSPWISRLGMACELEVVVANPRRVALISKNDKKSDRSDAETLARLGKSNVELLAPITHRSKEAQEHLSVQRSRNAAVSARTMLINHVRGVLKSHGYRGPSCGAERFATLAIKELPAALEPALEPILRVIQRIDTEIKAFDKKLEHLGREHYPVTQLLQGIPGVGPIVSLSFVLTLDDPTRFKGRDVGAYLGLVPRQRSSGVSDPQLHITKAGDHEMRRLLVIAANYILGRFGPDCDLRRYGLRIAGNGGDKKAKKRARVAVARKLGVLLHHLWKTGEVYDPFHLANKRGDSVPA
ncbi:MAG: IS110 family transposase [Thermoleophilia bacterium]|nr:IS110 family transposase [Thermoleophilia bacterium]